MSIQDIKGKTLKVYVVGTYISLQHIHCIWDISSSVYQIQYNGMTEMDFMFFLRIVLLIVFIFMMNFDPIRILSDLWGNHGFK